MTAAGLPGRDGGACDAATSHDLALAKGRYRARIADTPGDRAAVRTLRARAFPGDAARAEADAIDARAVQVLVEDATSGEMVACFRLLAVHRGTSLGQSYAAEFYDLARLADYPGHMVEIGRFCIAPGRIDPDIPRIAWGFLTRYVDRHAVALLFGCASFAGTDPAPYGDAFAWLRDRHQAPPRWQPAEKAAEVYRYTADTTRRADARRGPRALPTLLKTYLALGGWVSDHAVIDRDMQTLHVFTGVETARIPPARARLLRRIAEPG
ncbi:GNAT family N-acetyltransferase [Roseivivax sp. CAU 1753]